MRYIVDQRYESNKQTGMDSLQKLREIVFDYLWDYFFKEIKVEIKIDKNNYSGETFGCT